MSRWFRHYAGLMRDEKLVRVSLKANQPIERVVWVWGAILESAAEINDAGRFDFDAVEAAYFLRTDECNVTCILETLHVTKRIGDGRVLQWGKRQFISDSSAPRVAKHREKKKKEKTLRNVTVTECNAPESETYTESETDKNLLLDFEKFYSDYPKHVGRGKALRAYGTARKKSTAEEIHAGLMRSKPALTASDAKYIPHPATWLNAERWLDDDATNHIAGKPYRIEDDPAYRGVTF